ncbi:class I tRNA ligase family protein, partial [Clostridium haemolyticum]
KKLKEQKLGDWKVNYRLRDWLVSRQRYWGAPIPVVYCDKCGTVAIPEEQLPVELPYNIEFTPDGKSPLSKSEEFLHTTCPKCGGHAIRETDTLDTFVCSSWYYLRYVDNNNSEKAFDIDKVNKMLPVDKYVGGPEHACMHLLYARFITKALRDMGYLNFDEPFKSLTHQGLILGPDGLKMSKSKGNTIAPDDYIKEYGADVFRMYLMFGFAYSEGGAWSDDAIKSMGRFIDKVERLLDDAKEEFNNSKNTKSTMEKAEKELNYARHYAIQHITEDTDKFQFNTAIARIMEYTNSLSKYLNEENVNIKFLKEALCDYVKLLAPFAPHFSEEQWELLGNNSSIFTSSWPIFDPKALIKDEVEIAIQILGKIKARMNIATNLTEDEIKEAALNNETIKELLEGKNVMKVIVVKGRLVNIVAK